MARADTPAAAVLRRTYELLGLTLLAGVVAYFAAPPGLIERGRSERRFIQRHQDLVAAVDELDRLALVVHVDGTRRRPPAPGTPTDIVAELALHADAELKRRQAVLARLATDDFVPGAAAVMARGSRKLEVFRTRPGSVEALEAVLIATEQLRQLAGRAVELHEEERARESPLDAWLPGLLLATLAGIAWAGVLAIRSSRATLRDLAETIRQRDEQAALLRREQEGLLVAQAALDSSINAIAMAGMDGKIVYVNAAFLGLWGLDGPELALGHEPAEFAPEAPAIIEGMSRDGHWRGRATARRRDGTSREVQVSAHAVSDAGGRAVRLLASFLDVSDSVRSERLLRERARLLDQMQAMAKLGTWEWEVETGVGHWSDEQFRIFGRAPGSVAPSYELFTGALHPQDRERVLAAVDKALREDAPCQEELRILRPDGETRTLVLRGEVERSAEGRPLRMRGLVLDVTEVKGTQAALDRAQALLRSLFENASEGMLLADPETGRFLSCNSAMCRMLGYDEAELLELCASDIHPAEHGALVQQEFGAMGTGEKAWAHALPTLRKDGSRFFADVNGVPVRLEGELYLMGLFRDVTAMHEVQRELREQRDFARGLVDMAPVIVLLLDAQGNIQYVNPHFERLTGYRLDEVKGREWFATFLPERDRERIRALFQAATHGVTTTGNVNPILTRNGEEREIQWTDQVMRDERGGVMSLLAIGRDVAAERRAEEERQASETALRQAAARLEEAQRVGRLGSWEIDLATRRVIWSAELFRLYEIDPAEVGASFEATLNAIHPEDRQGVAASFDISVQSRQPYDLRHRLLMPDGRVKHLHVRGETQYDADGRPLRSFGTAQDITESIRAAETLKESEESLRALVNAQADVLFLMDVRGTVLAANTAAFAQRFPDMQGQALIGRNIWDLLSPEVATHRLALAEEVVRSGEPAARIEERGGLVLESRVYPVLDANRRVTRLAVYSRDVTERRRAELAIEAALREKETLLREIHHRVKNNLQIISSLLRFQVRKARSEPETAVLREAQDRLRAMVLVHEQLYRSSDLHNVDLGDYLRALTNQLCVSLGEASSRVRLAVEADEVVVPVQTALPCGMIVTELVNNAFKHAYPAGASGPVLVRIAGRESAFVLSVEDSGVGLPAEFDLAKAGSFGLSLVANLSDQLGATLSRTPGPGAGFSFEVPSSMRE